MSFFEQGSNCQNVFTSHNGAALNLESDGNGSVVLYGGLHLRRDKESLNILTGLIDELSKVQRELSDIQGLPLSADSAEQTVETVISDNPLCR